MSRGCLILSKFSTNMYISIITPYFFLIILSKAPIAVPTTTKTPPIIPNIMLPP